MVVRVDVYQYRAIVLTIQLTGRQDLYKKCHRREPLNEAHHSTFGILENYHCWRFHGSGVIAALQIIGLIFFWTGMHREHFWGRKCAFVFPIYVRKYRKYTIDRCIVMYTVCFRGDFTIKTVVGKCVTHSSILFICNTFCCWLILLSSLYIELALVCCTNPDYVFGTIFPNLNFVFASIFAARPEHIYLIRPIQKFLNCHTTTRVGYSGTPMGSNQKQRCGSEFAKWHDIYTAEECADEWRLNNTDLKLLENCVMNGFIMFMTATRLENSPQSFDVYTVSQSRSAVTSAENPAPKNSPQSIGELRNGHVANLQELSYQTGSKNGVM